MASCALRAAGIDLPLLALRSLASLGNHLVGLITELRRNLPVRLQDLLGWEDLLAVPGGVGGDLRRLRTAVAALGKLLLNLLRPKTGRVKVLLGIALDLRRSALALPRSRIRDCGAGRSMLIGRPPSHSFGCQIHPVVARLWSSHPPVPSH